MVFVYIHGSWYGCMNKFHALQVEFLFDLQVEYD